MSKGWKTLWAALLICGMLPLTAAVAVTVTGTAPPAAVEEPTVPENPPVEETGEQPLEQPPQDEEGEEPPRASDDEAPENEPQQPPAGPSDQLPEPPPTNQLPPPGPEPGFLTGEAFLQMVRENEGGTVVLTGDVRLTADVALYVTEPTQIEMGEYSVVIPEDHVLNMEGPLRFEGEGSRVPLFQAAGGLFIQDWVEIIATGDEATAICYQGETPRWLYLTSVSATGRGGVAVRGEGPLTAVLSNLAAPLGEAFRGPQQALTLDGSRAEPTPRAARVVERRLLPDKRLDRVGVLLQPGTENWADPYYLVTCTFIDEDEPEAAGICYDWAPVWQEVPEDLSKPGSHVVSYTLDLPEWFPVEIPKQNVWFHIMEPGRPYLSRLEAWRGTASILYAQTLPEGTVADMWFSTDDGVTWQQVSAAFPDSSVDRYEAIINGLDEDATYLFRLTAEGEGINGQSNAIRLASVYDDGNWGDRDNGDRGPQDKLPSGGSQGGGSNTDVPETKPPAEPEPSDENQPEPPQDSNTMPDDEETLPVTGGPKEPNWQPGANTTSGFNKPVQNAVALPAVGGPKGTANQNQAASIALPDGATVAVTGRQLAAQRQANANGAVLLGTGIKLVLPAALLAELALPDNSVLALRLERISDHQFEIGFWLDGQPVSQLAQSPFLVFVDWQDTANATVFCTGPDGANYPAQQYENGEAVFQLNTAGRYTLVGQAAALPEPPAATTNGQHLPVIFAAAGCLLLLAAFCLLGRRRYGKGGDKS